MSTWIWSILLAISGIIAFGAIFWTVNWAGDHAIERLRVHYGQPEDES